MNYNMKEKQIQDALGVTDSLEQLIKYIDNKILNAHACNMPIWLAIHHSEILSKSKPCWIK